MGEHNCSSPLSRLHNHHVNPALKNLFPAKTMGQPLNSFRMRGKKTKTAFKQIYCLLK